MCAGSSHPFLGPPVVVVVAAALRIVVVDAAHTRARTHTSVYQRALLPSGRERRGAAACIGLREPPPPPPDNGLRRCLARRYSRRHTGLTGYRVLYYYIFFFLSPVPPCSLVLLSLRRVCACTCILYRIVRNAIRTTTENK